MLKTLCFSTLLALGSSLTADETIIREDFDTNTGKWRSYGKRNPTVPKAENGVMRVDFRPELSGVSFDLSGVTNQTCDVSLKVKGKGRVRLGLLEKEWSYSPVVNLSSDKWQTITMKIFVKKSLMISLFSPKGGAAGDFVLVDDFTVTRPQQTPLADVAIPGKCFTLSDYPGAHARPATLGGISCLSGQRWYHIAKLPLPQSTKPLYIYIKTYTEKADKVKLSLLSFKKVIRQSAIAESGRWHWLKLGPLHYRETDGSVVVSVSGEPQINVGVSRAVISTDGALTPQALDATVPPDTRQGLVTLNCAPAPVIDGVIGKDEWNKAITLGNFVRLKQNEFAKEPTTLRLAHDDRNLYFAFEAHAYCLDPVANRLHEFRQKVTANDDKRIFNDDVVLLVISPRPGVAYDLVVNANGAVNDSRGTAPNYWGSRDNKWNSEATVKSAVADGKWFVEGAIPLAALEIDPAKADNVKFLAGRIEQRAQEVSSHQPMRTGFHESSDWGVLQFNGNAPGIRSVTLPAFRSGVNNLTIDTSVGTPSALRIDQRLIRNGKVENFTAFPATGKPAAAAAEVNSNGQFHYQYSVRHPQTLAELFISPDYRIVPTFTDLTWSGAAKGVTVNGKAATGSAPLVKGLNTIELEPAGTTEPEFRIGQQRLKPDGTWSKKGGKLTKQLLLDETVLWPNWQAETLAVSPGMGQQLLFCPSGLKAIATPNGYQLNLEIPEKSEILGASGYYKNLNVVLRENAKIKRDGKIFRSYTLIFPDIRKFDQTVFTQLHRWCALFFRPLPGLQEPAEIRFFASTPDRKVEELPQSVKLQVLPPVNGKQPKQLVFQMWGGWLHCMTDSELQKMIYRSFIAAGVNEALGAPKNIGIKTFRLIDFNDWNIDFAPFLAANPGSALIRFNGSPDPKKVCTTRLLATDAGKKYLIAAAAKWQQRTQTEHCDLDFEGEIFRNYLACFCPRCIAAFAAEYKLAGQLTPETIRARHTPQWTAFMNRKQAAMTLLLQQGVKQISPDTVFSVYTGYQSATTNWIYGVDWALLGGRIDLAMCGYGRNNADLAATKKALGKTPLLTGVIITPYEPQLTAYPTQWSKAELLRQLLDSTRGLLFYNFPGMNAKSFHAIGEVSRLASDFEPLFLNRRHAEADFEFSGLERDDVAALTDGKTTLLLLLNNSKEAKQYRVKLKKEYQKPPRNYNSGKDAKLTGTIPAGEYIALLLR